MFLPGFVPETSLRIKRKGSMCMSVRYAKKNNAMIKPENKPGAALFPVFSLDYAVLPGCMSVRYAKKNDRRMRSLITIAVFVLLIVVLLICQLSGDR